MKRFKNGLLLLFLAIMLLAAPAMAAETATLGEAIKSGDHLEVITLPITITSDVGGGALAATAIAYGQIAGYKLEEVEIVHGTSTASLTIKNSRGTVIWTLAAMDNTENEIQPGFLVWGVNPIKDDAWTIESGALDASDTIVVYLKFSKRR